MEINKLNTLTSVKIVKGLANVKIIRKKNPTKRVNRKAPHAIKCEVLLLHNTLYAVIENTKYPLIITNEDYEKATYAYSSETNPYWDAYTLKNYNFAGKDIEKIRDYWWLVCPCKTAFVNIKDNIAYLNVERMNSRAKAIISKRKPDYYASRRHQVL